MTQHRAELLSFGDYRLDRAAGRLSEGDRPVRLPAAGVAVLSALAERAGEWIAASELAAHLPEPDLDIDAVVCRLRRRLGRRPEGGAYIAVAPGRYVLRAAVTGSKPPPGPPLSVVTSPCELPALHDRLVGRSAELAELRRRLAPGACVTVVGPAGVGKTTLAIAAAETEVRPDGIFFVAACGDEAAVAAAIAIAARIPTPMGDPAEAVAQAIVARDLLLVIDTPDRALASVAAFLRRLERPRCAILVVAATPLGLAHEQVLPLAGLPAADAAALILQHRRLRPGDEAEPSAEEIAELAALAERLDGNPLAIELAMLRPSSNAEAAPPRLEALIAEAMAHLPEADRDALLALSVFQDAFSRSASDGDIGALLRTGLATVTWRGEIRLRPAVRAAALARLAGGPDEASARRRHAEAVLADLLAAETEWPRRDRASWVARHARRIEDVRAAIAWALPADPDLGAALTAAAVPLAFQMSLIGEFRDRVAAAARAIEGRAADPLVEMRLLIALGSLEQLTWGSATQADGAFGAAHDIAERIGIAAEQAPTLVGLWAGAFGRGDYPIAAGWADRLAMVAKVVDEPTIPLLADRTGAQSQHFLGRHARARMLAERVLRHPGGPIPFHLANPGPTPQVSMRIILARILWIEGRPDEAWAIAQEAMGRADTGVALCQVIALAACPIALWDGRDDEGARLAERLRAMAGAGRAGYWTDWADRFDLAIAVRAGRADAVEPGDAKQADMLATLHPAFAGPRTVQRVASGAVGWCAPEVLRAQALALDEGPARDELLDRAETLAREQGAKAWLSRIAATRGALTAARRR